jgi:hypothetical protein
MGTESSLEPIYQNLNPILYEHIQYCIRYIVPYTVYKIYNIQYCIRYISCIEYRWRQIPKITIKLANNFQDKWIHFNTKSNFNEQGHRRAGTLPNHHKELFSQCQRNHFSIRSNRKRIVRKTRVLVLEFKQWGSYKHIISI